MDDVELPPEITLAIAYVHEHLIEVEAVVANGAWCGRARAYTVAQHVAAFAVALRYFTEAVETKAEFSAGADTGIGLIAMRFYRVDRAGHIGCHVRLATGGLPKDCRPEEVFRLSIEVQPEAWSVGQFASQLGEMARTQAGKALLKL